MSANGSVFVFQKDLSPGGKKIGEQQGQCEVSLWRLQGDESYWKLSQNFEISQCRGSHCPESYWQNKNSGKKQLHVLSVRKPRPNRYTEKGLEYGYFVKVKVDRSEKPTILALVSQSMMQWNLEVSPKSSLKEVLIISPEVVWLRGLPEGVKLSFFSKDQICSYPTAWEDIKNPDNQFRRLFLALHQYTGLEISSFQGREMGREMRVPFRESIEVNDFPVNRGISSHKNPKPFLGIQWKRNGNQLQATQIHFKQKSQVKKLRLPEKTTKALYEPTGHRLFVINKYRFGEWNKEKKQFVPIYPPLSMANLGWPVAMTFNPLKNEIYIYNDERGGEIFSYDVMTETWGLFPTRVGYSFVDFYFDDDNQWLYGVRFKGGRIRDVTVMDAKGEVIKTIPLKKALDFSKSHWSVQMLNRKGNFWLKRVHPADPRGEFYSLFSGKDGL